MILRLLVVPLWFVTARANVVLTCIRTPRKRDQCDRSDRGHSFVRYCTTFLSNWIIDGLGRSTTLPVRDKTDLGSNCARVSHPSTENERKKRTTEKNEQESGRPSFDFDCWHVNEIPHGCRVSSSVSASIPPSSTGDYVGDWFEPFPVLLSSIKRPTIALGQRLQVNGSASCSNVILLSRWSAVMLTLIDRHWLSLNGFFFSFEVGTFWNWRRLVLVCCHWRTGQGPSYKTTTSKNSNFFYFDDATSVILFLFFFWIGEGNWKL